MDMAEYLRIDLESDIETQLRARVRSCQEHA